MNNYRDNMIHFRKVQTKFILAIVFLILLPLLSITFFYFSNTQNVIKKAISQSEKDAIQQMSENVNTTLNDMIKASNIFTLNKPVINILIDGNNADDRVKFDNYKYILQLMENTQNTILLNYSSYICLFDSYGNLYASGTKDQRDSYEKFMDQPWFQETIKLNGYIQWIAPHENFIKSEDLRSGQTITLARLIKGTRSHGGYGIITISIDEQELRKKFLSDDYETYIIDQKGTIISHNNTELIGTNVDYSYSNLMATINQQGNLNNDAQYNGKFISFSKIDTTNWILIKVSNYEVLFEDFLTIRNNNVIFIIIVSMIFILITSLIIFNLTKPIKSLTTVMKSVESGNLDVLVQVKGRDEIAQLGNGFNSMLSYIKDLIKNIQIKQEKEEQLRLEVMYAQINPHFLFNTLNTIKWIAIISQSNHVASLIEDLGRILEASLRDMNTLTTLQEELKNLESYLKIQKARYNQKISEKIEINPELLTLKVPKLILQPIVENSIMHGINEEKYENLNIKVSARIEHKELIITIDDDGIGMDERTLKNIITDNQQEIIKNRNGRIGVQNVHKRIQLMLGDYYGIKIHSEKYKGTIVDICLPIIEEGANND